MAQLSEIKISETTVTSQNLRQGLISLQSTFLPWEEYNFKMKGGKLDLEVKERAYSNSRSPVLRCAL